MSGVSGRFLGKDALAFAGSPWMLYEGLASKPLELVDPLGLKTDAAGKECDACSKVKLRVKVRKNKDGTIAKGRDHFSKCLDAWREAHPGQSIHDQLREALSWCYSKDLIDANFPGAGHCWILVEPTGNNGKNTCYGYIPCNLYYKQKSNPVTGCNGRVRNYEPGDPTHTLDLDVCPKTRDCIKETAEAIRIKPGNYCLADRSADDELRNCGTFAIEVLKKCGISLPWAEDDWIEPADIITFPGVRTVD